MVKWLAVMRATRILRALTFAGLAALVFQTHVFVAFRSIRVKIVQAPVAAKAGLVRVSTAGFPQVQALGPPFALIARIRTSAADASLYAFSVDGTATCERRVTGGAARRVDCAVTTGWGRTANHEIAVRGPAVGWTLEYLELATHHGNSTGAQTLLVLPGTSTGYVRPGLGWSVALWMALAVLLLVPAARPTVRGFRVAYRAVAGLIVLLLAVAQCSERVSDYRVVLAAGTFTMWLAVLLAPRLWTAGRWLTERAARAGGPLESARATANTFFDAHPAWRPTSASTRRAWPFAALALVAGLFCVPLFVNLGEPEARSDESIYFYAVERILDTGDWLTPRLIPNDWPFLEKPPLKFWLVAGGVRAGLLPRNEAGMRWLDAFFGAAGFLYVFFLGRRLAGSVCGVTAVLVLFTLDPLLFNHGLRSNNMEAALFLCYCGGVYHFARWVGGGARRAGGQAAAVAAYFVLGFMTKFVAALFLPVVCAVALAWHPGARARLRSGWRDWIVPALVTAVFVLPWFIYQHVREGAAFWRILVGTHVYQRFTASLGPGHLQPWHYYFVRTWTELRSSGTLWLVLAGVVRLAVAAVRGDSWLARLVLVWGVLPILAISVGTSKLVHYLYPFWPMLGLAAGVVISDVVRAISGPWIVEVSSRLRRLVPQRVARWSADDLWHRTVFVGVAAAAGATALWTTAVGPFSVAIGGAHVSNGSVLWPTLVAAVALVACGCGRAGVRGVVVIGLLELASVHVYWDRIGTMMAVDHPIRALRDCMAALQQAGVKTGPGVLGVDRDLEHYGYYYYLWRIGPWNIRPEFSLEETERHLRTPGEQTPVFVWHTDYDTLVRHAGAWEATYPAAVDAETPPTDPIVDAARNPLRSGARFNENLAVLLPGPFRACLPDVLAAAGQPLWKTPAPR
jgi:4-amino-4-deoxy-L-arabinose transferase-like glycosyltransferase